MSPEFKIDPKVKTKNTFRNEYPQVGVFADGNGVVIGTIPPNSKNPHRVMVRFGKDGLLNILPKDLKIVDSQ
ncbi:MAG TPA: hypothetical protein VJ065_00595 [Patescibacteria group bacterium]|nr:hypothetical protein [Patescibacteria group bacterium]